MINQSIMQMKAMLDLDKNPPIDSRNKGKHLANLLLCHSQPNLKDRLILMVKLLFEGPVGRATFGQAQWPEFDAQTSKVGRRESPESCYLSFTPLPLHANTWVHTQAHQTKNNFKDVPFCYFRMFSSTTYLQFEN